MSSLAKLLDSILPNSLSKYILDFYNDSDEVTNIKPNDTPNFVTAQGDTIFSKYSQNASGILTDAQVKTLVQGGVVAAIAQAEATFLNSDPTFSSLFTNTKATGSDGQFTANSDSETKVLASFTVSANQKFSFQFSADLELTAKEIENSDIEYNKAQSKSTFLVLDTTNPNQAKVLDYFGIQSDLISSDYIGNLTIGRSRYVTINNRNKSADIDGDNGNDSLNGSAVGTYKRSFDRDTNITVVKINSSAVELAGDTLIGNLGKDVIYGTIWDDKINGTKRADKIYASLGDDKLYGKKGNDNLDAGQGSDLLDGGDGDDTLYAGLGDDVLIGGSGDDVLVGDGGNDEFLFNNDNTLLREDFDTIKDFKVGIDKIVLDGWSELGSITNTKDGTLLKLDSLLSEQTILISGVSASQINSQSIFFT
ncbi:MAG: calcium-binding protein [Nostoc sp. ChiSLP02]|nr:calcium-binding protein [Nostoc sp. DedSLP05]MDZ8102252.1 calcium-binding protein [Nostoc sp. DedSLP01]MDZ8187257.1 calcium-binding protein [Nostoc sp. ChiSLP02]